MAARLFSSNIWDSPEIHYFAGPCEDRIFGHTRGASRIFGYSLCTYSNGRPRRWLRAVLSSDPSAVTCEKCRAKLVEMGKLEELEDE